MMNSLDKNNKNNLNITIVSLKELHKKVGEIYLGEGGGGCTILHMYYLLFQIQG